MSTTTDRHLAIDTNDIPGPRGWTRRTFLQALGAGAFAGMTMGSIADEFFGGSLPEAWAGSPIGPTDGIVIVITLYGGMDGLNVLVPYSNGDYYTKRANIAIAADKVLALDANVGLAPQLTYTKALYDAGQVAVIQGVGYPNPDLSHFTSMGIWMNGALNGAFGGTGWIGRWLDGQPAATADLAAASLDVSVPLHMQGYTRRAAGIPPNSNTFGIDTGASDLRMYNGLRSLGATPAGRGALHDTFTATMNRQLDLATQIGPALKASLPAGGELTRKLTIAARLLNANIGLRVLDISRSGFDNHENEPTYLPTLLTDLDTALKTFFSTLNPAFLNRVTIMTVSEFGRTQASNASGGTDHGTANTSFIVGPNVRGGLYGQTPSLSTVDRNGRMIASVDFRSMYGSVLDGFLGGGGSTIIGGAFQDLGLFAASPGTPSATVTPITLGPSPASGFVSVSPVRMFDTRDGTGGRAGAIGEGETWTFDQVGQFGIPVDATAVAWNLTAVNAAANTYVTVWPGGTVRPQASSLNPVPGLATPNLVISQLSGAGSVSMYNNTGTVDLIADLVGYFTPSSTLRLQALTPARLLDTRDGTGGVAAPVSGGKAIALKVNGSGGVPNNAKAVVLNVVATGADTASYLTVWPSDQPQPLASSLNMVVGQTVPNLVMSKVGGDGKV
ncbi:MAG: hypothetical protein JWL72_4245, partial [Ilumatobacteraceae bacterium]|nr:hypothetical protein [Ilumatobacteraceae bacterium]